jgi:hypothetical protein
MNNTPEPTFSMSSLCASSICGYAITESEKLDCLRLNKNKICRCCGNCDFSYKDVKFSCKDKLEDDQDDSNLGIPQIEQTSEVDTSGITNPCWNKICGTEDDKEKCLMKKRELICNCCKDSNNLPCTFTMNDGKIFDACSNTFVSEKPTITTKPRTGSMNAAQLSQTELTTATMPTWLWIGIGVLALLLIGGGIYYYMKNRSVSSGSVNYELPNLDSNKSPASSSFELNSYPTPSSPGSSRSTNGESSVSEITQLKPVY